MTAPKTTIAPATVRMEGISPSSSAAKNIPYTDSRPITTLASCALTYLSDLMKSDWGKAVHTTPRITSSQFLWL